MAGNSKVKLMRVSRRIMTECDAINESVVVIVVCQRCIAV